MGLLDELRMATGIAVGPLEAYQRAYEKGVLLGPAQFGVAAGLFREGCGSPPTEGLPQFLGHLTL
jgi:hypothetical protein